MRDIFVEETGDISATGFWPVKSDISESLEFWQGYRALAGSPFESEGSDSSSDCEDDTMSVGSSDPPSNDVSLLSEGIATLGILETNALGLVFMEEGDRTEAVATFAQQAEGLRAPRYHQDDRSCGRPNQKHHAQQEHVAFQSDSTTDETLVRGFPQAIGLWATVSDDTGPRVLQGLGGSPFEKARSFGDGCDQPRTYDHNLRAPRVKVIPLPEVYEEDLLYSGPALGGWLTGTLDGVPKTGLSCLDIGLPSPFGFAMQD